VPLSADGEPRVRRRSETLALCRIAAERAGVTRLGEVTGLARYGVPVFQAVRPYSRSLSVSQGKGLTPSSAMISALLEASELFVAESVPEPIERRTPARISAEADHVWCTAPRDPLAIRVDPAVPRAWLPARELGSGRPTEVPWDLVSLDFTREPPADIRRTSAGLATGGSLDEAIAGALAELIEHDCLARLNDLGPAQRRATELDLAGVDDPVLARLLRQIARGGAIVKAWDVGSDLGVSVFRCAILDRPDAEAPLPPAAGTGCHTSKKVALLRAILEAVQSRVTIIAGARDDLSSRDYRAAARRTMDLLLGAMSFGTAPLQWDKLPDRGFTTPEAAVDALLEACRRRTSLPVLIHVHEPLVPDLPVVRAICPGLLNLVRQQGGGRSWSTEVRSAMPRTQRKPVLFLGPSLPAAEVPDAIEIRPPARCGDIAALMADPPPAIGLIDGVFEVAPTVWHKEILDVMARGVPMLGGASLGALRAAELDAHGMIGIGRIFEAYRAGELRRDDAVMLRHAPGELGYLPITLALVDAEAALRDADIDPRERRQLQRIVRTTHFGERSWQACLAEYRRRTGRPASIDAGQLAATPSLKRADARLLVEALARGVYAPPICPPPPMTLFYASMLVRRRQAPC
jgi:ribosomal protein S12 methylthiotransferase accessory factor